MTGSGDRQEEDRKGTTAEVSKPTEMMAKTAECSCCGMSSDETCLRAEWPPA